MLFILLRKYIVKNTLPKEVLVENESNKNDITSSQSISVLFLQCMAMQQCNNYWSCGWEDRPTGGNPITASTALVVEDALSAWETLRRAQPVLQGGPQLVIRDLAPNVTDRREGKKIGDVSQGVVREQLLRLRGRETSDCRVVELSRTHSAHSDTQCTQTWAASAHRTGSSKPTTAFARLLPSAANYHQPL